MTAEEIYMNPLELQLALAAGKGATEEINRLVGKLGANANGVGTDGITVLFWPMRTNNLEGFKSLLSHGANPNTLWRDWTSAVHLAATFQNSEFLVAALEYGGDPNLTNPINNETPLFGAVGPRSKENVDVLLAYGANINWQNDYGETPLLAAASLNQYDVVYKLLQLGADSSIEDKWGNGIRYYTESGGIDESSELYLWKQKTINLLESMQRS